MKKSLLSLLLFAPLLMALSRGDTAPTLAVKNQDGKVIHFADYKGQFILVYFYPKDDTPGCTKEACSLRDNFAKIKAMNTVVFGASRQDEKSHKEFIAKHKLPFDLLVDTDGSVGKAFDVPTMFAVGYSKRETVLIGPDGKVLQHYTDVDPEKHTAMIIADIEKAGGAKMPENKPENKPEKSPEKK